MLRIRSSFGQKMSLWLALAALAVLAAPAIALTPPPPDSPAPARPEIWRYTLDNPAIETIMVDIDGNAKRDILTLENGKLYLRAETGFPFWIKRNAELDKVRIESVLTVANLDAQGPAEILAEAGADLWVIDSITMATLACLPHTQALGMTDLNGDGVAELYSAPRSSADPEYPPLTVYSLLKGQWTKLYAHPGCQLMRKPSQDAYQLGEKTDKFYIYDLNDDGKAQELMVALPAGKGWIGLGFDESAQFTQVWHFTEIQDGVSRLNFLDWTDANGDTYYDILAYQYDTRRIFNSDVVSLGDSIGSFPVRQTVEPYSSAKALKTERVKPGEWPMPHRDARWTARSPLKLGMKEAPTEAWSYALGGAAPTGLTLAELDGQPGPELLVSARGRLSAYASDGKPLWQADYLGAPRVDGFYDLDQDGKNEMLVFYRKVYSEPAYAVLEPATGQRLWEFKTPPYMGTGPQVQVGKFLPQSKGLQLFAWGAYGYYADLTLYDFSAGYEKAAAPVWTQKPEHVIYPTIDICDYDSDGQFEFQLLEHSRLRIYGMDSGMKERDFEWGTYRSYGSMAPIKFGDDPVWKLLITSWNSMMNVEMVDINETSGSLQWKVVGIVGFRNTGGEKAIKLHMVRGIGDMDGDGQLDVIYLKLNEIGDQKWHAYIRDLKTGKLNEDITLNWPVEDTAIKNIGDVDGDGKLELVYLKNDPKGDQKWHAITLDLRTGKVKKDVIVNPASEPDMLKEAGVKDFNNPPELPNRPEIVKPAPAPAGSMEVVDAATGKLQLRDGAGKVTTTLEVPEAVTGMICHPLVADLNGDGKPEVMIPKAPSEQPRNYKIDWLILQPAAQAGQAPTLLREEHAQLLLIFDRLQNGKNERLYLEPDSDGSRLVLKDSADKTVWTTVIPGAPEILLHTAWGDFNGDGVLDASCSFYHEEMMRPTGKKIFTIDGEYVRCGVWNGRDGQLLWHASFILNERPFGSAAVVYDVNGDGKDDLLTISGDLMAVVSGDSGKLIYDPRYTKTYWKDGGGLYCTPVVDDLDGDGKIEFYSQRAYGGIAVARLPYEPMWSNGLRDQGMYAIVTDTWFQGIADVDGDGKMELGLGVRKGEFRCYAAEDGRVQWSFRPGSPTSEVCSADVDGDGKYEFLFGTEEGWLFAVGGADGTTNPVKWKVNLNAPVGAPIVADVDGDGQGEILVCTGDGKLHCLTAINELDSK